MAGQFPVGPQNIRNGVVGTGQGGSVIIQQLPQARVFNSAALTITTGVVTALTFDSERYDLVPTGLTEQHSTSANTSRLTCRVAGLYDIGAAIEWAANVTGRRNLQLRLNATTLIAGEIQQTVTAAGVQTRQVLPTQYRLAVGDFVEAEVFQDSGGNLTVNSTGNLSPEFWFSWRSP